MDAAAHSRHNRSIVVPEVERNARAGPNRTRAALHVNAQASKSSTNRSPRLQFLFLVQDKINFEHLWVVFFAAAAKHLFRVHVHCTDQSACKQNLGSPFREAIIPLARSEWCNDLANVMNALLRAGLDSSTEDDPHAQEVFVFISGTTIPVKPFQVVYQKLANLSASSFCVNPPFHWGLCKDVNTGSSAFAVKHHQWLVLTREHAKLAMRYMQSHTFGSTPLKLPGTAWVSDHDMCSMRGCLDEFWHFAALFGLVRAGKPNGSVDLATASYWHEFPGISSGGLWVPSDYSNTRGVTDVQGGCWTYVFWGLGAAPLFSATSRKLVENTIFDVQKLPATFKRIELGGLMVLRRSPFLFARKFQDNVLLVDGLMDNDGLMEKVLLSDAL